MSKALTTNHPITAKILEQVKAINVQLPEAVNDKWAEIEQKEIALAVHIAELGYRYMDLREAVGHGEFLKALEERGIAQRNVQNHMNVAQFFIDMPDANTQTSAHLKPSQILELARLPEQEKQALTPEKITKYGDMSVRALRAEVKQLRLAFDEQGSVQAENERLKAQVKDLDYKYREQITINNHEKLNKAPKTLYGIHVEVANTREQAVIMGELLSTVNTELNHHVQRCTNSILDPQLARDCAIALYSTMAGSIMQLAKHLETLANSHGHDFLANPENTPLFDPDQVAEALSKAELVKGPFLATLGK